MRNVFLPIAVQLLEDPRTPQRPTLTISGTDYLDGIVIRCRSDIIQSPGLIIGGTVVVPNQSRVNTVSSLGIGVLTEIRNQLQTLLAGNIAFSADATIQNQSGIGSAVALAMEEAVSAYVNSRLGLTPSLTMEESAGVSNSSQVGAAYGITFEETGAIRVYTSLGPLASIGMSESAALPNHSRFRARRAGVGVSNSAVFPNFSNLGAAGGITFDEEVIIPLDSELGATGQREIGSNVQTRAATSVLPAYSLSMSGSLVVANKSQLVLSTQLNIGAVLEILNNSHLFGDGFIGGAFSSTAIVHNSSQLNASGGITFSEEANIPASNLVQLLPALRLGSGATMPNASSFGASGYLTMSENVQAYNHSHLAALGSLAGVLQANAKLFNYSQLNAQGGLTFSEGVTIPNNSDLIGQGAISSVVSAVVDILCESQLNATGSLQMSPETIIQVKSQLQSDPQIQMVVAALIQCESMLTGVWEPADLETIIHEFYLCLQKYGLFDLCLTDQLNISVPILDDNTYRFDLRLRKSMLVEQDEEQTDAC